MDAGSYKGATTSGNFVFFDVLPDRRVKGWRVNDVRRPCDQPGFYIYGPIDVGTYAAPVDRDGRFPIEWSYDTSIVWDENGDETPAKAHNRIAGYVQGSSAAGTVLSTFEFDRDGRHFRCSNGDESWTASRLP